MYHQRGPASAPLSLHGWRIVNHQFTFLNLTNHACFVNAPGTLSGAEVSARVSSTRPGFGSAQLAWLVNHNPPILSFKLDNHSCFVKIELVNTTRTLSGAEVSGRVSSTRPGFGSAQPAWLANDKPPIHIFKLDKHEFPSGKGLFSVIGNALLIFGKKRLEMTSPDEFEFYSHAWAVINRYTQIKGRLPVHYRINSNQNPETTMGSTIRKSRVAEILIALVFSFILTACSNQEKQSAKVESSDHEIAATETVKTFEYSPTTLAELENYSLPCGGSEMDLAGPVAEIAAALEDSSLLYSVKPLSDCSGIFHRVLKRMKKRCPDRAYPAIEQYRDTRDLARWYNEQGMLILINDALASANLIKPGAVLFFGQRATKYANFTAEDLFKKGTGINHVGVVVKVLRDDAGEVQSYELFHGHGKPGVTPASTTNYHKRAPRRPTDPPFGNGTEQWVAFATLVNPSGGLITAK